MTEHDETSAHHTSTPEQRATTRRALLRGAAIGGVALPFLAACGGNEGADQAGSTPSSAASPSGGAGGGVTLKTSEVPVGSGKILKEERIVVTQPTEGDFKAFTAVCTHQKCTLAELVEDKVHCNCHGSEFSIATGKNVTGPNGSAGGSVADLAAKKVSVAGGEISVT